MADALSASSAPETTAVDSPVTEPWPVRAVLIALTVLVVGLFLILPLVSVFVQAWHSASVRRWRRSPTRMPSTRSS